MNGNIKKYIYIIGTICIVFIVGRIFLRIFPWLLLAGIIAYIVIKIMGFIKGKKKQNNPNDINNKYDNVEEYEASTDDYTNGEIIDVEYEDIDNKKD